MRLLGTTELATFSEEQPDRAEALKAWAAEIRDRNWSGPEAMARDFPNSSIGRPKAVFRLDDPPTTVEALIDFRNEVLLVVGLEAKTAARASTTSETSTKHD
jgi:mRNA-degrading endonuclease HigB of HigAB toxin-antitoxin module